MNSSEGEAKFWLEPMIALAENHGISLKDLSKIEDIIKDRIEIEYHWRKHFKN